MLVALVAWLATSNWAQSSKEAKPETLLRWSFAGTKELAANKNLKVFNSIRELPESAAMRDAVATNLARAAANRFLARGSSNAPVKVKVPGGNAAPIPAADGTAALIQPLIADLIQHESRFQMDTRGAQDADWFLAVRLPENRVSAWSKHLTQLTLHSGMKGAAENQGNWTATRDNYKLSFSRSKDWTLIQGGFGGLETPGAKAFRDSLGKRSGKSVLDLEVNAPLLGKIWSAPQLAHYPKFTVRAEPRDEGFHSELYLDYPQDLGIKPEKWNVPADMIHDPLIGFTAIQGIRKKLESSEKFKALGAKQTPNQAFLWSQGISPFSVGIAAEVQNPGVVITNAARVAAGMKLPTGNVELATNRTALLWMGLPIVVPYLEPGPASHSSFVTAGLFPVKAHKDKPAPKELLAQLDQKNLVYYDWEITSERIQQWIPIWQLYYLVGGHALPNNGAPSSRFLQSLKTQIGNTITEGTLESPRRIKFTRQSHIGATALELVLLAHAFDDNDLTTISKDRRNQRSMPAPPVQ